MSFDERLRRHLHDQAEQLTVEPHPDAPAHGAARRQTRRRVAVAAAVVTIVGASAGWLASAGDDEPSVAAGPGDETNRTDDETSTQSQSATSTGPATPLTFTAADATGAPDGTVGRSSGSADDLYYVLTGESALGGDGDELVTWSGDGWRTSTFGDRTVSSVNAYGDRLFALSRDSSSGGGPAVGTSSDGGASWSWIPLDLPPEFETAGYTLVDAVGAAGHLVVAVASPSADANEALELARNAGLDIGWDTHQILDIDSERIRFTPLGTGSHCVGSYATRTEELTPEPWVWFAEVWNAGPDASPEDLERFAAIQTAFEEERYAAHLIVVEEMRAEPDCAFFADCQSQYVEWQRTEPLTEIYLELGLIEPGQNPRQAGMFDLDDATWAALNEAWVELSESPDYPRQGECAEALDGPMSNPENIETVTWESLGVTTPDGWRGAIAAFVIEDGSSRQIDVPFAPGWVRAATSTSDGFIVDIITPSAKGSGDGSDPTSSTTRWTGDEDGWEPTEADTVLWDAATDPDGTTYANVSGQYSQTGVARTSGNSTVSFTMEELFGTGRIPTVTFLDAAGYGVAAAGFDFQNRTSIIAFSPDGLSWATTELEEFWLTGVIVGSDSVMVLGHQTGQLDDIEVLIGRS